MTGARALLIILVGLTVLVLARPLLELPLPIGRNHNEGWNAHHAAAALEGDELYPPVEGLVSNNYPPLSFLVVGVVSTLTGNAVIAGRLASLLSLLVVTAVIVSVTWRLTSSRTAAAAAGLLPTLTLGAHFQNYVAMNDPQMLGHAFQYLGLAVFLARGEKRRGILITSALLVLGALVKHNLVALPLGITLWLAMHRRRDLGIWLAGSSAWVLLATLVVLWVYGMPAVEGVFLHARSWSPFGFALSMQRWMVPTAPLLIGSLVAFMLRPADTTVRLMALVGSIGLFTGAIGSFGAGISYNVIFDFVFAACVLGTVAVAELDRWGAATGDLAHTSHRRAGTIALLALILPALFVTPLRLYELVETVEQRPARLEAAQADLNWIEAHPGAFLCQDPALSYWTDRDFELGFFNYGQKLATGRVDGSRLWDRLEAGYYAVIQTDWPDGRSGLGEEFTQLLDVHYELARTSPVNGYFFLPKSAAD